MNLRPTFTRPTKPALAGLFVVAIASLAIGWSASGVAASGGSRTASPTAPVGSNVGGVALGAPAIGALNVGTTTTAPQYVGGTSSGTTAAIAYPVPGYNALGVAPQGTILAQGTGTADMKADGSDKAAALKKATDSALADAHAQALATAAAMGVQLQGIYSVSVASNTNFTYPAPDCVVPPLAPGVKGGTGATGSTSGGAPAICNQNVATPSSAQLIVTLIVAYKFA
jgi:hypothetical protein